MKKKTNRRIQHITTNKSHNDFLFVILLNKETILTLIHIHMYDCCVKMRGRKIIVIKTVINAEQSLLLFL